MSLTGYKKSAQKRTCAIELSHSTPQAGKKKWAEMREIKECGDCRLQCSGRSGPSCLGQRVKTWSWKMWQRVIILKSWGQWGHSWESKNEHGLRAAWRGGVGWGCGGGDICMLGGQAASSCTPACAYISSPIKRDATMVEINILKIGISFYFCLYHQSL